MSGRRAGWAAALLTWAAGSRELALRVLDDLEDERDSLQGPARGRRAAGLWFLGQVLRAVPPLLARRRERSRRRGGRGLSGWSGDARYAFRQIGRNRLYAGTAVLTLALGIGANTALFSVLDAVVLRPLPVAAPDRTYRASTTNAAGDIRGFTLRVAEFRLLAERTGVFESVGGEFPITTTALTPAGEPVHLTGRMITGGYFETFGVVPALGRTFSEAEIAAGDAWVVVVSHAFWTSHLGADAEAVGRTLLLDGQSAEVVGVLPASYAHLSDPGVSVYLPYTLGTSGWIGRWLEVFGRVAPGMGAERAEEEMNAVIAAVAETGDRRSQGWTASVEPLEDHVLGDVRPLVQVLFASVVVLLLIACVNVANLALARAVTRRSELGLRAALGAGRARLLRQLLAEHFLLAALGGAGGLAVGALGLALLVRIAPPGIPRLDEVGLDPAVLLFTAAVALGTGLLFGVVPALRASADAEGAARGARGRGGSSSTQPLLRILVVAEVALTLTLTAGAGLLVRTLDNLQARDLGFTADEALTYRIAIPSVRYAEAEDVEAFLGGYLEALRGLPGVVSVGAAADLPLQGEGAVASLRSEAWVREAREEGAAALQRRATPGLFDALGIPVLAGRSFDGRDEADGAPVLVLSESLARTLFPAGGAVGSRVSFRRNPSDDEWSTVIGVVADVQYRAADAPMQPQLYEAHTQSPVRDVAVVVRTAGDAGTIREPALRLLRERDPSVPAYAVATLGSLRAASLARQSFARTLVLLFAALAAVLTVAGIYGVLAFSVSRRTREIGVRMALGARRTDVVGRVVGQGVLLTLAALPLGVLGSWALGRGMSGLLFGVAPVDAGVLATTTAAVVIVAVLAAWSPARRAASIQPASALREE
ncbi:MAG: ABC transporter permease [Longimicrobiales bacterium]